MNKLYVFDSGVIVGSFYNYISSSKPIRDIYEIELCFCDDNLVEFLNVKKIDSIDFFSLTNGMYSEYKKCILNKSGSFINVKFENASVSIMDNDMIDTMIGYCKSYEREVKLKKLIR